MSGIVGICRTGEKRLVKKMLDKIRYRGIGGRKIIETSGGTLGVVYRRSGRAPYTEQPGLAAVWDGRFSGDWRNIESQAPLALAAFREGETFLIRDGLGVSPLYYGETEGTMVFASEVKALLGVTEEIKEFPPGHKYLSGQGFIKYFRLKEVAPLPLEAEEAASGLRTALEEVVEEYIQGRSEMGALLSGGIDSSAMSALAREKVDKLHTFAAGLTDAPDLEFAREVADHIGSIHHEGVYTFDELLEVLPEVVYHLESFDALLIRSTLTNYLVAKLAANYVPAVFSGEGGDELFAGYSYLKAIEPQDLNGELIDITNRLHNTALQRVDRSTAAHGTKAYVGFLDPQVVKLAVRIPIEYKLYREENEDPVEKWILRKAVEDLLPERVLWRPKVKFWEGAGVEEPLAAYAKERISDHDFHRERLLPDGSLLNTKEELLYYRIFKEHFGELSDLTFVGRTKGAPVV